jgi:hypothetical protein
MANKHFLADKVYKSFEFAGDLTQQLLLYCEIRVFKDEIGRLIELRKANKESVVYEFAVERHLKCDFRGRVPLNFYLSVKSGVDVVADLWLSVRNGW